MKIRQFSLYNLFRHSYTQLRWADNDDDRDCKMTTHSTHSNEKMENIKKRKVFFVLVSFSCKLKKKISQTKKVCAINQTLIWFLRKSYSFPFCFESFRAEHVRIVCRCYCFILYLRMVNGCRSNFSIFMYFGNPKRERGQQRKLYCIIETSEYYNHFDHDCCSFYLIFEYFGIHRAIFLN